jgi:hypothetical protein
MNIIEKLSSYNFFNYLLPGVLFVVLADACTKYSFVQSNIVLGAFVYYFVGLVISRFGSLVLEPLLKRTGFVRFADYGDFVRASKMDEQIALLSEVNNTYRTLVSLMILLGALRLYQSLDEKFKFNSEWAMLSLGLTLLIMFAFSYRKQTAYISKRIKSAVRKE